MNEITGASSLRIQVGALATTLAEMLPHSFSPSDIPDWPAGVRPPLERPLAALKRDKTLERCTCIPEAMRPMLACCRRRWMPPAAPMRRTPAAWRVSPSALRDGRASSRQLH
jgi:hypothetical protein